MKSSLNILDLGFQDYQKTLELQRVLARLRQERKVLDLLLLVEHNPVYTLGRNGNISNLLLDSKSPIKKGIGFFEVERGGDITYHGPGQLVAYPIFDLSRIKKDVRFYLRNLEEVLIRLLKEYGIDGERIEGKTGVWVKDKKIASIGVKISRWVTWHGLALNVNTDLSYFDDIILCGLKGARAASLSSLLSREIPMEEMKEKLVTSFAEVFGFDKVFPFYFSKEFYRPQKTSDPT